MFDRVLDMPRILNMPAFWIYGGSEYTKVVNMPGLCKYFCFWICHGFGYTMVLNMPGLQRVLNMSEYAWIFPGYVWLYLNVPESVRMAFVLHFSIVIPWKVKFDYFSIVAGSIWFCLLFQTKYFYKSDFKSAVTFGGWGGRRTWILPNPINISMMLF